jgi:putative PEP-CTERM system TPR-repeat lipoprotein
MQLSTRWTFRGAAAALIAASLAAGCDGWFGRTAEEHIERGRTHLAKGDVRSAIEEFTNAVKKQPDSVKAQWSLAEAYLDIEDGAAAESAVKRAAELGLHGQSAMAGFAEALILQAKFADAAEIVNPGGLDTPVEAEAAHLIRGMARLGQGELDRAREEFDLAQRRVPGSVGARIGLARLALAQGDIDNAERLLAEAQQMGGESRRTLELKGDIAFARGVYAESEAAYLKVLAQRPQGAHGRIAVARAQLASGKAGEAVKHLDAVLSANPNHLGAAYLRAVAALEAKDYVAARLFSDMVLKARPHAPSSLAAGAALFARGQFEQAMQHLDRYLATVPASEPVRRLLAAAATRLGQDDRAAEALQAVGQKEVSESDLLDEIRAALAKSGDLDAAIQNLQRMADLGTGSGPRQGAGGLKAVALDIVNEGAPEIESPIRSPASPDRAPVLRIVELLRSGQHAQAAAEAEALQKSRPDDPEAHVLAGLAHAVQGDTRKATASLEQALAVRPGDVQASRVLAVIAVRSGDIEGARRRLEAALQQNPGHPSTSAMLADLEVRTGRPAAAIDHLRHAIAKNPGAVELNLPLARLYLGQRQFELALTTVEPLLSRFPTDPALLEFVGRAELGAGRHREAVTTLRALADAQPASIEVRLLLANAYAGLPDANAARRELDAVLAASPNHREARIMLARLAVSSGWLDEAEKLVGELREAYRDEPAVAEVEGGLRLAQQRPGEAIPPLRRAVEKGATANRILLLARAQWAAGEREAAETTFQAWLDDHPEDRTVRFAYASYLGTLNRLESARFEYQTLVDQSPDDAIARNELAYFLIRLGDTSNAVEHARRAIELAPQNANIIDTLASALFAKGETGEAVELFHRALALAPDNRTIRYHFANALAKRGDKATAKAELGKILGDAKPFDERAEAENLMRQLGG